MTAAIEERLDGIFSEVLGIDRGEIGEELSAETSARWDSASYVLLILSIEEEFGVTFGLDDIERCGSRKGLLAFLRKSGADQRG